MPIFDQGYQHWKGPLTGHTGRWLAVTRHGVRAALKSRNVRMQFYACWFPALVLVTVLALWGLLEQQAETVLAFLRPMLPPEVIAKPQDYRSAVWTVAFSFFFKVELFGALFLVLAVGPNLVSRDLRFNALPLYFSRPLRRIDYFLGKLGVIGFFLTATVIGPAVLAYFLGVAFSLDLSVVRDTHRLLWGGILYGLVIAVSAGTFMLALSSLSRRSIYVGLGWAGFCFLTLMLSGILIGVRSETEQNHLLREKMAEWLVDHPPPAGIQMYNGLYPSGRRSTRSGAKVVVLDEEQKKVEKWHSDWATAYAQFRGQAELARGEAGYTDWRPVISYASNLDRMGDWLLDTDSAWVVFGRTIERPRAVFGPAANLRAGGRLPREFTGPANDRMLADRFVWQFPWYWSAGTLAGLWLLSAFILTTRIKSLDRLK